MTNVANTYLRHKVMAEAEDETILDLPQTEYAQQITEIARFMLYLLEESAFPRRCVPSAAPVIVSMLMESRSPTAVM